MSIRRSIVYAAAVWGLWGLVESSALAQTAMSYVGHSTPAIGYPTVTSVSVAGGPCVEGCPCAPNANFWGAFPTVWRSWPCDPRLERTFPSAVTREVLPTPRPEPTDRVPRPQPGPLDLPREPDSILPPGGVQIERGPGIPPEQPQGVVPPAEPAPPGGSILPPGGIPQGIPGLPIDPTNGTGLQRQPPTMGNRPDQPIARFVPPTPMQNPPALALGNSPALGAAPPAGLGGQPAAVTAPPGGLMPGASMPSVAQLPINGPPPAGIRVPPSVQLPEVQPTQPFVDGPPSPFRGPMPTAPTTADIRPVVPAFGQPSLAERSLIPGPLGLPPFQPSPRDPVQAFSAQPTPQTKPPTAAVASGMGEFPALRPMLPEAERRPQSPFVPQPVQPTTFAAGEQPAAVHNPIYRPADDASRGVARADLEQAIAPELEGFCPVTLGKREEWTQGDSRWSVAHQGRNYWMSGPVERECFLADPFRYVPAFGGNDPVLAVEEGRSQPGVIDHCVNYDGRLYMFSTAENLTRFRDDPKRYGALPPVRPQ